MQLVDPEQERAQEQYTERQGPACVGDSPDVLPATTFASRKKLRRSTSRSHKGLCTFPLRSRPIFLHEISIKRRPLSSIMSPLLEALGQFPGSSSDACAS